MNYWLINIISAILLCILFAGILIPQILLVAFRRKLFDEPNERKIHHSAVPRLGGIAFTPVLIFSISLLYGIGCLFHDPRMMIATVDSSMQVSFALCALLLLYLVGMADDLIGVRYIAKFVIQILCAVLLILGGLCLLNLHGVFWIHNIPMWIGVPFTILAVVYIVNAINLIDGIDGLASGLSIAATFIYGSAFYILGHYIESLIAFSTMGVLIPFFYYNVFGKAEKQKKIFMGDTGSLTIGLILTFLSLDLYIAAGAPEAESEINPFVLAFAPLIIPCFDVVRVFMRRMRLHKHPFLPDKSHIHHKILALGFDSRFTMVTIVSCAILLSLFNYFMSLYLNATLLLIIDIALWSFSNVLLSRAISRRQNKEQK